jgi:regulatory protein
MNPRAPAGRGGDRAARAAERRARRAAIVDPQIVLDAAAPFLAVRPRSVFETRTRLRHLGYAEGVIETALQELLALGYLDDDAFGRSWLESRDRAHPRGEAALRRELRLKGLTPEAIAGLLAERAVVRPDGGGRPDLEAARSLLERRARALAREPNAARRRQRAYALLARNGFDPETCREAVAGVSLDAPGE